MQLHIYTRVLLLQSCPILCYPMDCSLPGTSVLGILQARILEWTAMPSSRGPSRPRDRTCVSYNAGEFFTTESSQKPIYITGITLLYT